MQSHGGITPIAALFPAGGVKAVDTVTGYGSAFRSELFVNDRRTPLRRAPMSVGTAGVTTRGSAVTPKSDSSHLVEKVADIRRKLVSLGLAWVIRFRSIRYHSFH